MKSLIAVALILASVPAPAQVAGAPGPWLSATAPRCDAIFSFVRMDRDGLERLLKTKRYLDPQVDLLRLLEDATENGALADRAFGDPGFRRGVHRRLNAHHAKLDPEKAKRFIAALAWIKFRISSLHEQGRGLRGFGDVFEAMESLQMIDRKSPEFVNTMATELSDAAELIQSMNGLPPYQVFKVIKENVRRYLGQPSLKLQDVLMASKSSSNPLGLNVVAISNVPFEGRADMPFGLNIKELDRLGDVSPIEREYTWKVQGAAPAKARVRYEVLPAATVVPPVEASPRYAEMLADGKLSGAVVIAQNLTGYAHELSQVYLRYFRDQGFRFQRPLAADGARASELVLDRVRKGQLDYMIREGHGEFAVESLVTWGKKLQIYEGRRAGTPEENVLLIFPGDYSVSSQVPRLLQGDLGQALRAREKPSQFVYFDTACAGARGIQSMIAGVGSSGFTPIGSMHLMDTFTPTRGDAIFEFLKSFRRGLPWSAINGRVQGDGRLALPDGEDYLTPEARTSIRPFRVVIDRHFQSEF